MFSCTVVEHLKVVVGFKYDNIAGPPDTPDTINMIKLLTKLLTYLAQGKYVLKTMSAQYFLERLKEVMILKKGQR